MTYSSSATSNNPMDPTQRFQRPFTLHINLGPYLTPSLNTLLNKHWSHLHKEKEKAANALRSALIADPLVRSMWTTLLEAANLSSINFAMQNSSRMMTRRQSKSSSRRKKSRTKINKARPSR